MSKIAVWHVSPFPAAEQSVVHGQSLSLGSQLILLELGEGPTGAIVVEEAIQARAVDKYVFRVDNAQPPPIGAVPSNSTGRGSNIGIIEGVDRKERNGGIRIGLVVARLSSANVEPKGKQRSTEFMSLIARFDAMKNNDLIYCTEKSMALDA